MTAIVVVGGFGRMGAVLTQLLERQGHEVRPVSRRTGADLLTGEGLDEALAGAEVVIDVSNSPSFKGDDAREFFTTATPNLLAASARTGIQHHILLSIVGAERLETTGYFKAKLLQEEYVAASGAPYSIVRSTQFFEFLDAIVRDGDQGDHVRVARARVQPIAARDAAMVLAELAVREPVRAVLEIAGPDGFALEDVVRTYLTAKGDHRLVVADPEADYFGAPLANETLLAGQYLRFGSTDIERWLKRQPLAALDESSARVAAV